jgi:hypothetical protein
MQRSSIIATVIAAGGVLIAGSVASVAVINAASSSQPDSETIQLVAAGSPETPATQAATPSQAASPAAALPSIEATPLPKLPKVERPAQQAAAVTSAPATSGKAASKPSASKESSDDSTSSESAAVVSIGQARSIVLKQGDGVAVVGVSKQSHQGYSTWAVRIARANGEELTGYVDRASGVVVDWNVNKEATPAAQPTQSASDDDDREDDSIDHEDDSVDHEDSPDDHDEDDD